MAKQYDKRFAIALLSFLFLAKELVAQTAVPMADAMRAEGKIYVVVAVLTIIFIGISVYLIRLDRKTKALKQQLDELMNHK